MRAWRASLLRAGRPGPTTIAKAYRLLSSVMATAVVDNIVSRNPCIEKGAGVERSPEMRVVTPEQVAAIANAIEPRYRALVLTAAYAGCRWGELAALRQRSLDLLRGTLVVEEQVAELRGGTLVFCPPKSDAGRRVVHLPAGVVDELRSHLARFADADRDGLVFPSEKGGVLRQSNFRDRQWAAALRTAGAEKLRFHDLRHVAGTLATVSGATIREVQARLGHASPAAAYRYQHVLENRDAEIARRLDGFLRRGDEAVAVPAPSAPVAPGGPPSASPSVMPTLVACRRRLRCPNRRATSSCPWPSNWPGPARGILLAGRCSTTSPTTRKPTS